MKNQNINENDDDDDNRDNVLSEIFEHTKKSDEFEIMCLVTIWITLVISLSLSLEVKIVFKKTKTKIIMNEGNITNDIH